MAFNKDKAVGALERTHTDTINVIRKLKIQSLVTID